MIICKSPKEIEKMREASQIVVKTLKLIEEMVRPGISTKELDRTAERYIKKERGRPAFKGYRGFPASICVSVNEEVVHGVPNGRRLKSGDIIGIDVGVEYDSYYGDAAVTLPVGEITPEAARLIEVTKKALAAGVEKCQVGNRIYDISSAIQEVAEGAGFSVVRDYVGHGIGQSMHEDPQIPNYGRAGTGPYLKEGMVFALEPMINIGGFKVEVLSDKWTVVTEDRSLSAHFEHTVAVTRSGPEILTLL